VARAIREARNQPDTPTGSRPRAELAASEPSPNLSAMEAPSAELPTAPRTRVPRRLAALASFGALLLLAAESDHRTPDESAPGDLMQHRVAVGNFINQTGDSTWNGFSRMLSEWIRSGIAQTGLVPVLDATTTDSAEGPRGGTGVATSRVDASLVIGGAFYLVNDSLEIHLRLLDPGLKRLTSAVQPVTVARDEQRRALSIVLERVAGALAQRLDDRLRTISAQSSPPVYSAYLDYINALDLWQQGRSREASRLFESAFEKDTSFAAALLWATITAPYSKALAHMHRLQASRGRLAPVERHGLDFMLAIRDSTPNAAQRAYVATRRAAALAPDSHWAWNTAYALSHLNRHDEAAEILLGLDPTRGWLRGASTYWIFLAEELHEAGRYREQREALLTGFSLHGTSSPARRGYLLHLTNAAAALGDTIEARRWLDELLAYQGEASYEVQRWDLEHAAAELRFHGHRELATATLETALSLNREWVRVGSAKLTAIEREDAQVFRGAVLCELGRFRLAETTLDSVPRPLEPTGIYPASRLVFIARWRGGTESPPARTVSVHGWHGLARARATDTAGAESTLRDLATLGSAAYLRGGWYWEAAIQAGLGRAHESALALKRAQANGAFRGMMSHVDVVRFRPGSRDPQLAQIFALKH